MKTILSSIIFRLIFFCSFYCVAETYAQSFEAKLIEAKTSALIKKVYPACVRIWGYDTVKKVQNSAQFSGVVVTAEGHILTAAHAIKSGKIYMVNFPDGSSVLAEGKGRIASESQGRPDMAMVKIIKHGIWPHAEMGWSSSLKLNSLCVSIAYPATLNQKLPSVRLGRISRLTDIWGFIVSTCAMEPGDSGGPLFDDQGRVVGIHSRIDVDEKINYEVPVDLYRKYWTALNVAEDYTALPEAENFSADPNEVEIVSVPELEDLDHAFATASPAVKGICLRINSQLKGKTQHVYGTLLMMDAKPQHIKIKSGSYLLSKSSLVGDAISVQSETGERIAATVISRDKDQDLVLLHLPAKLKSGLRISTLADSTVTTLNDIGKFLFSIFPGRAAKVSVLGSSNFGLDKKFSSGYFGASATFIDKQIILTRIAPGSPAAKAGLLLQDQITGINGVPISLPPEYGKELMKYEPGDSILIQGVRASIPFNSPVSLDFMPESSKHPADYFSGGKSQRRDGFDKVFTHDAIIKPEECGGPVFDRKGKFYGINIARFSRTSALVIPADVIRQFMLKNW